ncbi:MAG: hypothetical protein ACE5GJ_10470, partial [Gemmatimonadota bacterium]
MAVIRLDLDAQTVDTVRLLPGARQYAQKRDSGVLWVAPPARERTFIALGRNRALVVLYDKASGQELLSTADRTDP